ncbi:hypothetical protein K7432_009304 [Basidiobolus ranarum]|uniref:Uncharacterized protein n=1 Tax=Basidiobolus ranarum TaxID=34480 RepID=A0ABR2WQH3_9FUNG
MYSANSLLLVLSSALLGSSLVVERGYVPPVGISYCQDLLSHLNTRYNANIHLEQCTNRPDGSSGDTDLINPADLPCNGLVARVKALGINVDAKICLGDNKISILPENRHGQNEGDQSHTCRDIVARLRVLGIQINADVCLQNKDAAWPSKDQFGGMSCEEIVAHAKALHILKADVDICLKNGLQVVKPGRSDGVEYNECHDIAARLRLLGIKLDANVCIGISGAGGWSKERTERMSCDDVVAHAKVLSIIKADVDVCLNNILNLRKAGDAHDVADKECDDIAAHLRLLGIKLDTNVCVGVKGSGVWSKSHIDRLGCEGIMAKAKVLGIIKSDVNVCLNNVLNLGKSTEAKGSHDDECESIVARLRVLGIDVAADICLNIKVGGKLTKDEIQSMTCEAITAHAKALHILKVDAVVCLDQ